MTRRHELSEVFADEDVVDRIFDYVRGMLPPNLDATEIEQMKREVRREFGGRGVYIQRRRADEARARAQAVLALFNGQNATEVARVLGIGRATVYRIIKQAHK
ncbi:helix-turn-helix domain-containing protein [Thiohalocapsa marina]|uniref:helix-turn-helix domain-containing protein n=1 Tax=Thiohalocapsa marina TaxID=424902 RepID=UPI0036DB3B95